MLIEGMLKDGSPIVGSGMLKLGDGMLGDGNAGGEIVRDGTVKDGIANDGTYEGGGSIAGFEMYGIGDGNLLKDDIPIVGSGMMRFGDDIVTDGTPTEGKLNDGR